MNEALSVRLERVLQVIPDFPSRDVRVLVSL